MFTLHIKTKLSITDFFGKCEQIRKKLRICSHLPGKPLMGDFLCTVSSSFLIFELELKGAATKSEGISKIFSLIDEKIFAI